MAPCNVELLDYYYSLKKFIGELVSLLGAAMQYLGFGQAVANLREIVASYNQPDTQNWFWLVM